MHFNPYSVGIDYDLVSEQTFVNEHNQCLKIQKSHYLYYTSFY